jgi:hypothetical protein
MDSYISARGRALALQILVGLQIAMLAFAAIGWAIAGVSLESGEGLASAVAVLGITAMVDVFDLLLFLAATVVFMTWVYRSIANLPALGSMTCRFTPSGAVWSFFIPFVNLVRGHQVMATIWTESQPALVSDTGFHLPRKTTLVNWWWGLYLFSAVASLFLSNGRSGMSGLRAATEGQAFFHLVRLSVAIMFFLMIRATQNRQDAMWEDLERKRSVPKPTADYLR